MNLNEILTPEKISAILKINEMFPDSVFCGSLGLVLNGKLNRQVGDLDVITKGDWFNPSPLILDNAIGGQVEFMKEYRIPPGSEENTSHIFMVGKDTVSCWKMKIDDVSVDMMHNRDTKPLWEEIDFFNGQKIKIETSESAIKAKLGYVIHDKLQHSATKHLKDLILMDVDRRAIVEALDESFLFGKYDESKYNDKPSPMDLFKTRNSKKEGDDDEDLPW